MLSVGDAGLASARVHDDLLTGQHGKAEGDNERRLERTHALQHLS